MPVEREADGVIRLRGLCGLEEAEPLLSLLLAHPGAAVDCGACLGMHAAVAQVLLALAPPLAGGTACGDPFLERWLMPAWRQSAS